MRKEIDRTFSRDLYCFVLDATQSVRVAWPSDSYSSTSSRLILSAVLYIGRPDIIRKLNLFSWEGNYVRAGIDKHEGNDTLDCVRYRGISIDGPASVSWV